MLLCVFVAFLIVLHSATPPLFIGVEVSKKIIEGGHSRFSCKN